VALAVTWLPSWRATRIDPIRRSARDRAGPAGLASFLNQHGRGRQLGLFFGG